MRARVYVTLKPGVMDPQGETLTASLKRLGFDEVCEVRVGKYLEIEVEGEGSEGLERVDRMCRRLLANPVLEDYRIEAEG
ncbi:MAG: phosphoribosylformylglycinamidine synthase subunit PurS [Bacillota bacterium]